MAKFHQELNAGEFQTIYSSADEGFRQGGKEDETLKFLIGVHSKLGNAESSSRGAINVNTNTIGTFITVSYNTNYERGAAQETFVWRKTLTGNLLLFGYNVQSNAFITQ